MVKQTVLIEIFIDSWKKIVLFLFPYLCFSWKYSFTGCASHLIHRTGNIFVSDVILLLLELSGVSQWDGIVYKEKKKWSLWKFNLNGTFSSSIMTYDWMNEWSTHVEFDTKETLGLVNWLDFPKAYWCEVTTLPLPTTPVLSTTPNLPYTLGPNRLVTTGTIFLELANSCSFPKPFLCSVG